MADPHFPEVVIFVEPRSEAQGSVRLANGVAIDGVELCVPEDEQVTIGCGQDNILVVNVPMMVNDVRFEERVKPEIQRLGFAKPA